ncbi:unnamed protein product [Gongylonema pulchrum]|uniref:Uncharacterized protein n=1 Tax=Gongylonema pulchrum TaxID=637853 RepID=A0A183DC53_9BILA|nr:unnamed protein product [Gongylonema pulchrum]
MLVKLFGGDLTALEIVMLVTVAILIILFLVIIVNCCMQCCCDVNDLHGCEEEDRKFLGKEYYDEICLLLYRHKQMEMRETGKNRELQCKKQVHIIYCQLF